MSTNGYLKVSTWLSYELHLPESTLNKTDTFVPLCPKILRHRITWLTEFITTNRIHSLTPMLSRPPQPINDFTPENLMATLVVHISKDLEILSTKAPFSNEFRILIQYSTAFFYQLLSVSGSKQFVNNLMMVAHWSHWIFNSLSYTSYLFSPLRQTP